MKLGELFSEGVPAGARDLEVSGLTLDSRKVRPGFVFAAVQGAAAHGRDFIPQAKAAGAVAVLSAGDVETDLPNVVSADPRRAIALAAAKIHPRQPEVMVAVTGTNGKSSTVDFLRQIWARAGHKAASLGTLGAIGPNGVIDLGHTTPDPVAIHQTLDALVGQGVTHAAMEASSHGLDQRRLDGVRLSVGAFLNLTQDHLDYHGTMDIYREAKMRLWSLLPKGAPAIINADAADADAFRDGAVKAGLKLVTAGWRAGPEGLKISEIQPHPNGQTLTLIWHGAETDVELPLIGEFQALNAVTAAALALATGSKPADVWAGLGVLKPVKGRMEHVGATREGAHVFVDYAHTPDGLNVLLRAARPHAPGRIVLVFGCGGDRDKDKRGKMGAVAKQYADVTIVTDDNPRSEEPETIRAAILAACPGAIEIGDRAKAIREAVGMLRPGDALMIAGKGHETGQTIKGVSHPFSDQDEAQKALAGALHA